MLKISFHFSVAEDMLLNVEQQGQCKGIIFPVWVRMLRGR